MKSPSGKAFTEACKVIRSTLRDRYLSEKLKRKLIRTMIWWITEEGGKYTLRYESKRAQQQRRKNKRNNDKADRHLRHEHVHRLKLLVDEIMGSKPKDLEKLLKKRAVACVVTKEEHDELNRIEKKYPDVDGWPRYEKMKRVTIVDTMRKMKVKIKTP